MDYITRVPVPIETLAEAGTTNAYLVGTDPALLVDPAGRPPELTDAVEHHGVSDVLVTHTHPDHVSGVAHYARGTDATVWALAGRAGRFERATGVVPDRLFRPGDTLTAGDGTAATILDTPGHAVDHIALAVSTDSDADSTTGVATGEAVLSGDLVVAEGSVVVGAPDGDMRAYLTSLRRLHARDPTVIYPGHGSTIDDPRGEIARLIEHRLRRERRVLVAVQGGAESLDEILDAAYDKDLTGVRKYARSTILAHLQKLAVESKVAWDGERAAPR